MKSRHCKSTLHHSEILYYQSTIIQRVILGKNDNFIANEMIINKSFLLKGMFARVYHISIYTFRELKNNKIYFED